MNPATNGGSNPINTEYPKERTVFESENPVK